MFIISPDHFLWDFFFKAVLMKKVVNQEALTQDVMRPWACAAAAGPLKPSFYR